MNVRLCPWLGIEQDPEVRHMEPSESNLCHVQAPPADIELEHQERFCLQPGHVACPYYREREEPPAPEVVRAAPEDEYGPEPGLHPVLRLWPWLLAALALAAVAYFYGSALLKPRATATPAIAAVATEALAASPTATATATPSPTPAAVVVEVAVRPTVAATPTPYPGGRIYTLSPAAGAAGWVASHESRGNHLGDSYLYAGLVDGAVYHGLVQFDLSAVPRGAAIYAGTLELTGLDAQRLGEAGAWEVRLLAPEAGAEWSRIDYQRAHNAAVQWTLPPALAAGDLAAGQTNAFALSAEQLQDLEERLMAEGYALSVRIDGPLAGESSLFAWDSGSGPATEGRGPRLVLSVGAPPETPIPTGSPPPTATPEWVVVTSTPTPANAVTAAAIAMRQTVEATTTGLPTAMPLYVATATPRYVIVTNTPTPANSATAVYVEQLATAYAILTGTPTPTPPNLATAEWLVVTSTPTPANAVTAAAVAARATAWATTTGTPTPLPNFVVTATPVYVVVTRTPTPGNVATAVYVRSLATANVILTGTPTATPFNLATATLGPRATATPELVWLDEATPRPTATATSRATPLPAIPREMKGKIAFLSDRGGEQQPQAYLLDPNTGRVALLTDRWPYEKALAERQVSPDGLYTVGVRRGQGGAVYQVFVAKVGSSWTQGLTFAGVSYDPAWSPRGDLIAYVSQEDGDDEVYVVTPQGENKRKLTNNSWEWDKHPSFSPDGSQIVFWSNRVTGRKQLWIMNADGSQQRALLQSPYNDWDPVWIR